jgi:hypothetical protein
MHSILDTRTGADLAARLIVARRKIAGVAAAGTAFVTVIRDAELKEAESVLVGVMCDALRECEIVAGSATRDDLCQLGFTPREIDAHLAAARDRAHRRQARSVSDTV